MHPDRANTGHFIVMVLFAITSLLVYPFHKKKKLPKLLIGERLHWQVDNYGVNGKQNFHRVDKFYTEQEARDFHENIKDSFPGISVASRCVRIDKRRAHSPVIVVFKKSLTRAAKHEYMWKRQKRYFWVIPEKTKCYTSFLWEEKSSRATLYAKRNFPLPIN
jgi:hypothetical protein